MIEIKLLSKVGTFAENKDVARDIRVSELIPLLENGELVVLDFGGIEGTTQSFIHALISDLIRKFGIEVLDKIMFKNCNENIQKIIKIVVDYMQE